MGVLAPLRRGAIPDLEADLTRPSHTGKFGELP